MSVQSSQKTLTRTFKTVNLGSSEPVTTVRSVSPRSGTPVSTLPYAVNGSYDTAVRYLVPMQQQQQIQQQQGHYVLMQQPMMQPSVMQHHLVQPSMVQHSVIQQPMIQQPMMQQMVSPVYLQTLPRVSVSSQESDLRFQQQASMESISRKSSSSVFSSSSPIKSPEPSAGEEEEVELELEVEEEEEVEEVDDGAVEIEEVETVTYIQSRPSPMLQKITRMNMSTDLREAPQPTKLDTRYFGELLAEVYRKNSDIYSCISDHVSRIRGRKHQMDLGDYKVEKEEVEKLIPKGATELTKQQMRYLLQTRLTADKSMRLLLSTFSSLREELIQMSEDLRRLESEKESLERDLSYKADQARQYDSLLEAVRENNRQLQVSLKEASAAQRSLESQVMSSKNSESNRDFKMKELEGRMRALEKENDMLRQKLAGQGSSTLHIKTEELSRQYNQQLSTMREEKDLEIQRLRSQITKIQTEVSSSQSSTEKSLSLKITELMTMLETRQTTITRQEEEIRKLMQERSSGSGNVTKTIITKRYRNQYPILGLLSDDYQVTSPVKEAKTIVIERTGEMIKQE
ncbi:protein POF1B isoform X2 [Cololabis saira]|nr:protein POF1B isoform X2 [Cololabis saira]